MCIRFNPEASSIAPPPEAAGLANALSPVRMPRAACSREALGAPSADWRPVR